MEKGLRFMNIPCDRKSTATRLVEFHKHFGSGPLDISEMWYDLMHTDIPNARVEEKEKNMKGFKMFLAAHYFLWTYPKNASLIASCFGICERYSRGEPLWKWIYRIAALKEKKIVWDPDMEEVFKCSRYDLELFCFSLLKRN